MERQDELPKGISRAVTTATLDIAITGDNHHDNVPKRKYVRMPKTMKIEDDELVIKEYEENLDSPSANEESGEEVKQKNVESEF